jgi:phosphatidate cytidylyltransferase
LASLSGLVLLGPAAFLLVLAVSLADVAAYCGGRSFRGPYLSPPPRPSGEPPVGAAIGRVLALFGALTLPLAVAVAVGGRSGPAESMVRAPEEGRRHLVARFRWPAGLGRLAAGALVVAVVLS